MGNLERRISMSPSQFALMFAVTGTGTAVLVMPTTLVPIAEQHTWVSVLLGAVLYFFSSIIMIKLGDCFPGQSIIEYLPRIWGKALTAATLLFFTSVLMIQSSVRVQSFGREIVFFMFDRTPIEIVILPFVVVCAFGAIQDLGTIIRLSQWLLFMSALPMLGLLLLSMINVQLINLYPLWPVNISGIIKGAIFSWPYFWGYEVLLILLPAIDRQSTSLEAALASSFIFKVVFMLLAFVSTVGSMTVAGVNNIIYPTLLAVRGIDLPGTFIERLDNYLLLSWIPFGYITIVIWLYIASIIWTQYFKFKDHRPFIIVFSILIYLASMSLHDFSRYLSVIEVSRILGFAFSIIIIPTIYLLVKWQRSRCSNDK
ncbi:MAG: spore germination protein [Anaerospora sp.]|nr:spore germination protein [Anaerospora sp.]